jgi:hypothetical protein
MHIPYLKLTKAEMVLAVGNYLKTVGISLPVKDVDKCYSGSHAFVVDLAEPQLPVAQTEPDPLPKES